ncbi:hypothetical protein ACFE04_018517 [Oxalis oulophora]
MEVGDIDGVAIITINNPPLNLLSIDVMSTLKEAIEQALRRDDVKAIVITGSNAIFSGGFDVNAFGKKVQQGNFAYWSMEFITDILEAAKKPVVAAIDGLAIGGGLEIGLACHARISTSSARLGLTELKYGILPGFGGTQRLPRLVGLSNALDMILMSKLVSGDYAESLGLVDAIVPANELIKIARCWALDISECKRPWSISLYRTDRLESLSEARIVIKLARAQSQKQSPNLKHLLVCIDVIEEGIVSGPRAALLKEAKALQELRQSETCKSLVHFFFAQQRTSKIPGITDLGLAPTKVNKIAIVRDGLLGYGIATELILRKYRVILKELNEKDILLGVNKIKENLQVHVKEGKMSTGDLDDVLRLLNGVLDYESFSDVDLVIEAVNENISSKQQIFADLERYCPDHCIFASTSSTLNMKMLGEKMKSSNRIVGTHFFSPGHTMSLLEIVRNEMTSPQVVVDLINVGKRIKKIPIVVSNCTGLAVNWMFFPYSQSATMAVERALDIYQIDQALTKFGMLMGPFRMINYVGFAPARKYIDKANSIPGVTFDSKLMKFSEGELAEIILFPVVNEACRLLEQGTVVKSADLDVASVIGCGFPSYRFVSYYETSDSSQYTILTWAILLDRGGIIFWADSLGSNYICSKLEEWSITYGEFFQPCRYLAERASKGLSLEKLVQTKSQL